MSSLRRDLFERRLWPLVLLLVVAIAAVPFLVRGHGSRESDAAAVPVAPAPVAIETGAVRRIPVKVRKHLLKSRVMRDPFAAGVSHISSKPTYVSHSSSESSSTTTAAMVSPTPSAGPTAPSAGSGLAGIGSSGTGSSGSSGGGSTAPPAQTQTQTVTTTQTTTTSADTPGPTGPWTVYAVGVRYAINGHHRDVKDIARLTPVPSSAAPKAMFLGVMSGGRTVAFALGAGVAASGPGTCRPDHDRCSVIALEPGQSEQLSFAMTDAELHRFRFPASQTDTVTMTLRVGAIAKHTTDTRRDAVAAFERHSQAGACELALGDPISYDGRNGSLDTTIDRSCRKSATMVPFPGTGSGS